MKECSNTLFNGGWIDHLTQTDQYQIELIWDDLHKKKCTMRVCVCVCAFILWPHLSHPDLLSTSHIYTPNISIYLSPKDPYIFSISTRKTTETTLLIYVYIKEVIQQNLNFSVSRYISHKLKSLIKPYPSVTYRVLGNPIVKLFGCLIMPCLVKQWLT